MATANENFVASPVDTKAVSIGRTDQGVDVSQKNPFLAVADGVISYIDPNFYKGTPSVYETLTHPITVNGRTYSEVYYSETPALVKAGTKVKAGDPIIAGGNAELGFAAGNLPAAHSVYHEGDVTQAGKDYATALARIMYEAPTNHTPDTTSTNTNTKTGETSTSKGPQDPFSGTFGALEKWLTDSGKLVLAYVLLVGVAGALFVTGLKGLGVAVPKIPKAVPVPA